MAIDEKADEWDIFLSQKGIITNLTENSGFRNEDPQWSPDGKSIVFKRGRWDTKADSFVYDLALVDITTKKVTMLTDDDAEEAMPCFSADGKSLYYASYTGGIGSVMKMEIDTGKTEVIFSESGVTAYYPVVSGDILYFTKWYSADNKCDQIMCYDGSELRSLPFDSEKYDCSDACPAGGDKMIFSSTMNGGYDLYYYDGKKAAALDELNSDKNELGADIFLYEDMIEGDVNADGEFNTADAVMMQRSILGNCRLTNSTAGDLCKDGILDVFDLIIMKQELVRRNSSL